MYTEFYLLWRVGKATLKSDVDPPPNKLMWTRQMWLKGGFPVTANIICILAANICRQFFFVINTVASTICLVENFQLICNGSSRCLKWPNNRMVAVVKHWWL